MDRDAHDPRGSRAPVKVVDILRFFETSEIQYTFQRAVYERVFRSARFFFFHESGSRAQVPPVSSGILNASSRVVVVGTRDGEVVIGIT